MIFLMYNTNIIIIIVVIVIADSYHSFVPLCLLLLARGNFDARVQQPVQGERAISRGVIDMSATGSALIDLTLQRTVHL